MGRWIFCYYIPHFRTNNKWPSYKFENHWGKKANTMKYLKKNKRNRELNTFVIFPYTTPFSLYIYIYRLHKISKRKIPGFFFVIELPVSHMDPLLFWLDLMALYKPSAWIRLCVWPACSCCAPPASIFIHVSKLVYSALLNVLRRYRPCRYIVRQQQQHGRQCARTVATATAQQTRHSNYYCTRYTFI